MRVFYKIIFILIFAPSVFGQGFGNFNHWKTILCYVPWDTTTSLALSQSTTAYTTSATYLPDSCSYYQYTRTCQNDGSLTNSGNFGSCTTYCSLDTGNYCYMSNVGVYGNFGYSDGRPWCNDGVGYHCTLAGQSLVGYAGCSPDGGCMNGQRCDEIICNMDGLTNCYGECCYGCDDPSWDPYCGNAPYAPYYDFCTY